MSVFQDEAYRADVFRTQPIPPQVVDPGGAGALYRARPLRRGAKKKLPTREEIRELLREELRAQFPSQQKAVEVPESLALEAHRAAVEAAMADSDQTMREVVQRIIDEGEDELLILAIH
jgi:hypothetical protein